MRLGAILAAVALLTVGCLSSPTTEPSDDATETARKAAAEHMTDPHLVEMWGVEPPIDARENGVRILTHVDDAPGDGQAPGWGYHFRGAEQSGFVITASELGVVAEAYAPLEPDEEADFVADLQPEVPTDEIADILAENASWPPMDENTTVVWYLEHGDEERGPVWFVHATRGEPSFFSEGIQARVDADTGEILGIGRAENGGPEGGPGGEGGCQQRTASGQVAPGQPVSVSVDLPEQGTIHLDADATGVGPLNLTIAGPNGTVWATTVDVRGSANQDHSEANLQPGTYEATASTQQGVLDVELRLKAQWGVSTCPDIDIDLPPGAGPASGLLLDLAPWSR